MVTISQNSVDACSIISLLSANLPSCSTIIPGLILKNVCEHKITAPIRKKSLIHTQISVLPGSVLKTSPLTSSETKSYVKEKISPNLQKFPANPHFTLAINAFSWYPDI
jgi:hypothetical protein